MRKLLASTLAIGALAGGVTAGAALASPDHPGSAKAAAADVSRDRHGDRASRDRASNSRDRSSGERAHVGSHDSRDR